MKAFLCHSSLDKPYVDRVARKLDRARVQYDAMCFEPFTDFRVAIREALSSSGFFAFFASRASLASYWTRYEIDQADHLLRRGLLKGAGVIIIDDQVAISELPRWMQSSLVEQISKPSRATRHISEQLNRLMDLKAEPLFLGRERLLGDFAQRSIQRSADGRLRLIIMSGLPGIGRQTFLRHALKNTLSLSLGARFPLDRSAGLDVLHRQLLDELGELDSKESLVKAAEQFARSTTQEKVDELALMFAGTAERNIAPVIVDAGALLDENGKYLDEAERLLRAVGRYEEVVVCLVHNRRPNVDDGYLNDLGALHFRVPPLDLTSTSLLVRQSLRQLGIDASSDDSAALAVYMGGYPPAVLLATNLVREYGLSTVLADATRLVDFKIRTFTGVLDQLRLDDADWKALRLLSVASPLPLEALAAILEISLTAMASRLTRLIDLSLVIPRADVFEIAAPIRETVFDRRGYFTNEEFTSVVQHLKAAYWDHNILPPAEVVAVTVHAAARSGSADLAEFRGIMLPSALYKAAEEQYNEFRKEGWEAAKTLCEQVLLLDSDHRRARILLFKSLIRLNEWKRAEPTLDEIDRRHYSERHYLRGFYLWKQDQTRDAIAAFERAMLSGHRSVPVYHGLAACLYRAGRTQAALQTVRRGLESRRPNKYLLDLGAQIATAVGDFKAAGDYLDELRRLREDRDFHHRMAALLAARGEYADALRHSELANQGGRGRFEVLSMLANIVIELNDFGRADELLMDLDTRFSYGQERKRDVRVHLRCKRLLREGRWADAEQTLEMAEDKDSQYYWSHRGTMLRQKIADTRLSPGERAEARDELQIIERDKRHALPGFSSFDAPDIESSPE